ncbi:MAG: molybdopterin converting factor [Rickettsiales bacterium]|jgi:molybdopterin converting factor small subunit
MKNINIKINFFGAFRQFDNGKPVILQVADGADLDAVKQALRAELLHRFPDFKQDKLLEQSPFADEREILRNDYICTQDVELVILPPVSGG